MRALAIDDEVRAEIARALQEAPVIGASILKSHGLAASERRAGAPLSLAERERLELGWQRPPSAEVLIPHGYLLCISREEQPMGLVLHLSVSVDGKPGMVPSYEAVEALADECGAKWPPLTGWVEEWQPGRWAVNILAKEAKPAKKKKSGVVPDGEPDGDSYFDPRENGEVG